MKNGKELIGDVVVVFKDGHRMEFSEVTDYGVADDGTWYVERFGTYDIWINSTEVRMIGRKYDVDNIPRGAYCR